MSAHVYDCPIIFQDLQRGETYFQLCEALCNLQKSSEDIFSRINARIDEEKDKLGGLSARVSVCHAQIDSVAAEKRKAITVLSSVKYPATKDLKSFTSVYATQKPTRDDELYNSMCESARRRFEEHGDKLQGQSKIATVTEDETLELFRFFADAAQEEISLAESKEGLGKLPANITSVANLLLFNSTENPYKKYQSWDNLEGGEHAVAEEEEVEALPEAPQSVQEGGELPTMSVEGFGFKPSLGPVPEMNLPNILPNLPMVADLNWSGAMEDSLPSIAPSTVLISALPDIAVRTPSASPYTQIHAMGRTSETSS
eukprot:gene559-954_t